MEAKKLQKVPAADFNVARLRHAAEQGNLYIVQSECEAQNTLEEEILFFVSAIQGSVNPKYRHSWSRVWREISNSPVFIEDLALKKGHLVGHINKTKVFILVAELVSRHKFYLGTKLALACSLAGTSTRPIFYNNSSNPFYGLTLCQLMALDSIVNKAA